MMGSNRRWGIGLLAVLAGVSTWVTPVHGQSPAQAVGDLLGRQLAGNGLWRQDNPNFQSGGELPAYWLRHVQWGPGHEVIVAGAFAVSEDGGCEPVAHMVYFWDLQNRRVAVNSFNAGGVRGEGHLESKGPSGTQLMTTIGLPDGSSLRMREYSDHTRPDASVTHPERLVDGTWIAGDSVTWRRHDGLNPCG